MQRIALIVLFLLALCFGSVPCFANQKSETIYNKTQKLIENEKYTEAIAQLQKAYCVDSNDYKVMGALSRQYLNRGEKYMAQEEWGKAANDFRSSLFYMYTFYDKTIYTQNSAFMLVDIMEQIKTELIKCEKKLKIKNNPKNRMRKAKLLEIAGLYSAAGCEYILLKENSKKYSQYATERLEYIQEKLICKKEK